jgi:hypothetical protein
MPLWCVLHMYNSYKHTDRHKAINANESRLSRKPLILDYSKAQKASSKSKEKTAPADEAVRWHIQPSLEMGRTHTGEVAYACTIKQGVASTQPYAKLPYAHARRTPVITSRAGKHASKLVQELHCWLAHAAGALHREEH